MHCRNFLTSYTHKNDIRLRKTSVTTLQCFFFTMFKYFYRLAILFNSFFKGRHSKAIDPIYECCDNHSLSSFAESKPLTYPAGSRTASVFPEENSSNQPDFASKVQRPALLTMPAPWPALRESSAEEGGAAQLARRARSHRQAFVSHRMESETQRAGAGSAWHALTNAWAESRREERACCGR